VDLELTFFQLKVFGGIVYNSICSYPQPVGEAFFMTRRKEEIANVCKDAKSLLNGSLFEFYGNVGQTEIKWSIKSMTVVVHVSQKSEATI
jgi:hypothetical protein